MPAIDIQPLAILREIDRTGSLTQAADKLNLTQSAVSHAIRRFEERHGVKLWEREGHKPRLTPTGEYLRWRLSRARWCLRIMRTGGAIRVGMECQDWLIRFWRNGPMSNWM
ncbi:LysR family transcriptional regulator [Paenirhodobacter sp.]|uniref:LysR family transcriptional regulator n=1 Tax=Paenirhodobacter sp. TaxID=1965326 RepID=UPI003B41A480